MTNLNLVRPGFRLTGSGAGAPSVLVRGGHSFFRTNNSFRTNKSFRTHKSFRTKEMDGWMDGKTIEKRTGLFRVMRKMIVFLKKEYKKLSFYAERTNFLKDLEKL